MTRKKGFVRVLGFMIAMGMMASMTGCTTAANVDSGIGLRKLQLSRIKRHEYQILDTVEGTGKTKKVLGIQFPLLHQYYAMTQSNDGNTSPWMFSQGFFRGAWGGKRAGKATSKALFDALSKAPNSDAFYTMSQTLESHGFPFFFRIDTATVKGKAIRFKTDAELGDDYVSGPTITIITGDDDDIDIDIDE